MTRTFIVDTGDRSHWTQPTGYGSIPLVFCGLKISKSSGKSPQPAVSGRRFFCGPKIDHVSTVSSIHSPIPSDPTMVGAPRASSFTAGDSALRVLRKDRGSGSAPCEDGIKRGISSYPMVICYITMENHHLFREFSHEKWWFSIVM